ncbi:MAG: hypothetical protein H6730_35320 [Deltaproteobacteria bacterium]|nr:hypothetical protein [Deltaproteobacteria bacterium]
MRRSWVLAGSLAIATVGCNKNAASKSEPKAVTPEGKMKALDPEDQSLADLAVEVLAKDLGVTKGEVQVDTVRAVDWPDSSLGCPQPDRAYMQVITPGHKITLRVGKQLYFVHEANGRALVCKKQKKPQGAVDAKLDLVWGKMALAAKQDLMTRLGVEDEKVRIASARPKTWPDAALGCPEEGKQYAAAEVEGWVIKLRVGERDYTYHTDLERVIACPAITAD